MTTTVRPTSQTEKPYKPTWYETFRSENQLVFWESCGPGFEKLYCATASIQTAISTSANKSAVDPTQNGRSGRIQTTSAPATGSRIRTVVSQPLSISAP